VSDVISEVILGSY